MRLLQALFVTLERRGHSVAATKDGKTYVTVLGETFNLSLRARSQLLLPVSDNYFCRRRGSKGVSPTTWRHSVVVVGRSVAVTCSAGAPTGAEAPAAIPGT